MAAFDFPSSPSVNQTYTANGVTWKWNGTMWMRVSGAGYLEKIEEGNSKIEVDDSGSGNIIATTDGTEALRVDSSGRVLLGTTTVGDGSADNLTIADVGHCGMTIRSGTSSVGGIYLGDGTSGSDQYRGFIEYDHSGDHLRFGTSTSEKLRITSGGDISIGGISSPRAKLDIEDAGTSKDVILRVSADDNAPYALVVANDTFNTTSNRGFAFWVGSDKVHHIEARTSTTNSENEIMVSAGDAITFRTNVSEERLRIDSSGRVLIGATTNIGSSSVLQVREDGFGRNLEIFRSYDSANTPARIRFSNSRGTSASPTIVVNGDDLGEIRFNGHDGTNYDTPAAAIFGVVDGTPGVNDMPGRLEFHTTPDGGSSTTERFRITSEGNIWTVNSSIMHGSGNVTNFESAGRTTNNNVSIRAGSPNAGTTPTNSNSAIKIYPAGVRSTTTGNLTGGIAWQHLDPDNGTWDSNYGPGSQIWMGAALHDTPGQERDRFNLWMNSGTAGGSQPNQLAIEAYPNGMVRHPKVPAFMVRNSNNANAFTANAIATWNVTIFNNGSGFASNKFTAPIDGLYFFSCMMLSNASTRLFHDFRVNGVQVTGTRSETHAVSNSYTTATISMVYNLSASDYVEVYVANNNAYGGNYANFNGYLVG